MSNTFLLEKYYAWTGILAEPILKYFDVLRGTRSCNIENSCVYSESGLKVSFSQIEGFELISGIEETMIRGYWEGVRESNKVTKEYPTISLDDLLDKYNAPNIIDYLSMDTEGSEFDILNSYSFSRKINVITVEHEGFDTKTCIKITNLLEKNGYIRIFEEQSLHDAWFVNQATYDNMLRRYGLW
jgi:FkbM family methyltransferase